MSQSAVLTINIDGAARGNPGPAAFAYVIAREGRPVVEEAGRLGTATNNLAEYTALVRALERAADLGGERLFVRSDSELLVRQMNGLYRVKNEQLRELHEQATRLRARFRSVSIVHVSRAQNSHADRLCNEVLDGLREPATASGGNRQPRAPKRQSAGEEAVQAEAIECLRSAATAWAQRDPAAPSVEQIWDQLWSILQENGVVRSRRSD